MREWLRAQIAVLLQFLLCTAMLAAVAKWRVSPFIQYAALGVFLLCLRSLLGNRSREWIVSLSRLPARLRESGSRLSKRLSLDARLCLLALRLPEPVVAPSSVAGPEATPDTAPEGSIYVGQGLSELTEALRGNDERCHDVDLVPLEVKPDKIVKFRVRSSGKVVILRSESLLSERVDDALRLDEGGAGAFGLELRSAPPVSGAGQR